MGRPPAASSSRRRSPTPGSGRSASATVTSQVTNGDLVVSSDAGDAIVITDVGGSVKINGGDPGNGAAASSTIDSIAVTGGPDANTIDLKGVTAAAFPALASVTVNGAGGNDLINGSQLADTLDGGEGDDRIIGDDNQPNTDDVMRGEAGDDTLVWNPGDDDDLNDGGDGNDTAEVNGADAFGEQFTVKPSSVLPGGVRFDRTGPTPPGIFNIEITGNTERLDLNGNGDDDTIRGTGAEDLLSGGKGRDVINSRDKAADEVDCNGGFDVAFVDRRDTVRGCEIVLGGRLRVKHLGKALTASGGTAAVRLQCVAARRCTGRVALLRGGKSLGSEKYRVGRKAKTFRVKLNRRAVRLLARAPRKGLSVALRIDARDTAGNGWRTSDRVKLKRQRRQAEKGGLGRPPPRAGPP